MNIKRALITMLFLTIRLILNAQDTTKLNFNDQNPVLKFHDEQLTNKNGFTRYYALTRYREGVNQITEAYGLNFKAQIDKKRGTHRIMMYNLSIQDMLTHGLWKSNKIILEVKDPYKYRYEPQYGDEKEWLRKNAYCYEIMMPIGTIKDMHIIDSELCRLFNVKCSIKRRLMKTQINENGIMKEKMQEQDVFVITEVVKN